MHPTKEFPLAEDVMLIGYLASELIDGSGLWPAESTSDSSSHERNWDAGEGEGDRVYKILFSDRTETHFFSLGVESGAYRRDSANIFAHDFLDVFHPAVSLGAGCKIVEELMVDFAGLTTEAAARIPKDSGGWG